MTDAQAAQIAAAAVHKAKAKAGDSEAATKTELLAMMEVDPELREAMAIFGLVRLWESQNLRH